MALRVLFGNVPGVLIMPEIGLGDIAFAFLYPRHDLLDGPRGGIFSSRSFSDT